MTCARCAETNSNAALFCFACGHRLRPHDEVECENHSGMIAAAVCVICHKPICDDCSVSREEKIYCDGSHARLTTTHTKVAFAPTEFDAELIAANLSSNGMPALLFPSKRYSMTSCLTDDNSCSVFVRSEARAEAERFIDEADLKEFLLSADSHP